MQSYALLTVKGRKRSQRVPLPAAIGAAGTCDVVVNAAAVAGHAYTLYAERGTLKLVRASGDEVPLAALAKIGLVATGPVRGTADGRTGAGRGTREWMAKEAQWFRRRPALLRGLLLGALPQPLRLAAWAVAAIAGLTLALEMPARDGDEKDLSQVPLAMSFDAVRMDPLRSNTKDPQQRGYETGATFAVEGPAGVEAGATLLSFMAAGLNYGKELILYVNEAPVWTSEAEASCTQDFCAKSVRLEKGLVKAGPNTLRFAHTVQKSSYFLARLHLRPLPEVKATEIEEATRLMDLAERSYAERNIVPENLVSAGSYAEQAIKIASERDGAEALKTKAIVLKQDIERAHETVTADLWSSVAIQEKVGKKAEVLVLLNQLLRLHPDPHSSVNAHIKERLMTLKEPVK